MGLNLTPFLHQLKIVPKRAAIVPFRPNSSQRNLIQTVERQFDEKRRVRVVVLKARQTGFTTVGQALEFAWAFLFRPSFGLALAHNADIARHMLSITNLYWNTFPFRSLNTLRYNTKNELVWDFGSSIRIATAESPKAAHGRTIHALHGSEVSRWPDPLTLMTALGPAIPDTEGSFVLMESTAHGVGDYFYNLVMAAHEGESEYELVFVPWHQHEEYFLTDFKPLGRLDSEEHTLRRAFKVTDAQLAWRRVEIQKALAAGDENLFQQEYPSTIEEAFISTGNNLFNLMDLRQVYHPVCSNRLCVPARGYLEDDTPGGIPRFVGDTRGPLKIYKGPSRRADVDYVIAGDPTLTTQGDPAVIQVLNRITFEQVAVWEGHIDPISFATEIAKLARFYNNGLATTETEGGGFGTVGRLSELYPRIWQHQQNDRYPGARRTSTLGWSSSYKRKEWAIGWLRKMIRDQSLILHDSRTFEQLRDYGLTARGMGPLSPDGHDDHVMALSIGIVCSISEGPLAQPPALSLMGLVDDALDELGM